MGPVFVVNKPILLVRPVNVTPMLIPNLGLGYLATRLRAQGHDVEIMDCIKDRITPSQFEARIQGTDYGIIGFQVYTFDMFPARQHLEMLARVAPSAMTVAGGPHPGADPEGTMDLPNLDFAFRSEAEAGFPKLANLARECDWDRARVRESFGEFPGIENLVYRDGHGGVCSNPVHTADDLDELPFPAWDLIDPRNYPVAPQGTFTKRIPVAPTVVTRGCPFECTFCAAATNTGKPIRYRSPENVIEELAMLKRDYGVREIHFEDDNFTLNQDKCAAICEGLIREELDLCWALPNGVRLDTLDTELLKLMERSGCYSLAVGIESGSQRVLDLMKKDLTVEEIEFKVALIKRVTKMKVTGFFIIGYPGETKQEIRHTIRFARKLHVDKANYGIYMPLPGTESYDVLKAQGDLNDYDPSRITEYRSAYAPPGITNDEMRRYLKWAFFSFYARPKIITDILRGIQHRDQVKILVRRFFEVFSLVDTKNEPLWHS